MAMEMWACEMEMIVEMGWNGMEWEAMDEQMDKQMKQWAKELISFHFQFNLLLFECLWLWTKQWNLRLRFPLFFFVTLFPFALKFLQLPSRRGRQTDRQRDRDRTENSRTAAIAFSIFSDTFHISDVSLRCLSTSLQFSSIRSWQQQHHHFYCCSRRLSRFLCSTSINF